MNSPVPAEKMAVYLARKIFEAPIGCEPDKVQRIQFRGYDESDMGGFCESALVTAIREALEALQE